jgi:hypothetical protein
MPKVNTFKVEICRISYSYKTIEVKAYDHVAACALAHHQAGDHIYTERSAVYEIEDVGYVKKYKKPNAK